MEKLFRVDAQNAGKCYQNDEENHKKNNQTHTLKIIKREGESGGNTQTPCTGYAYKLSCFLWVVRGLELHTHPGTADKGDGVANMIMIRKNVRDKFENRKLLIVNCKLLQMCRKSPEKSTTPGITRVTNVMVVLSKITKRNQRFPTSF